MPAEEVGRCVRMVPLGKVSDMKDICRMEKRDLPFKNINNILMNLVICLRKTHECHKGAYIQTEGFLKV